MLVVVGVTSLIGAVTRAPGRQRDARVITLTSACRRLPHRVATAKLSAAFRALVIGVAAYTATHALPALI